MKAWSVLIAALLSLCCAAPAAQAGPPAALQPLPDSEWTPQAAAHLLRRAGFGGTPQEIQALYARGLKGAVDWLFDWKGDDGVPPAPITVTSRPTRRELMGKSPDERRKIYQRLRREDLAQMQLIREWWVHAMIETRFPLRERLTLFWSGHFTTSYRDVRDSYHVYMQNTLFRRYAAGNFGKLLHAVSKDPAMLRYLNNNQNRAKAPNENYAREVMELFTLGVGHYTETDVKQSAKALTGWTFVGNRFYFNRRTHDNGMKTFLGQSGNFDGDDILNIILQQPACAKFISSELFRYFAYDHPSPKIIDALADQFRSSGYELEPMLKTLFLSRAFYSGRAVGTRIKSPVDLLVELYRDLGLRPPETPVLSLLADNLGQGIMDPPNVKGWERGKGWITTSHLLDRYNIAGAIVGLPQDRFRSLRNQRLGRAMGLLPLMEAQEREMAGMDEDVVRRKANEEVPDPISRRALRRRLQLAGPVYDVAKAVAALPVKTPEAIVDHYTSVLLARPPSAEMRASLISYLNAAGGFRTLKPRQRTERLHGLLRLIVSTPEFQVD